MFARKEVLDYLATVARFWRFEVVESAGLMLPPSVPPHQREKNE